MGRKNFKLVVRRSFNNKRRRWKAKPILREEERSFPRRPTPPQKRSINRRVEDSLLGRRVFVKADGGFSVCGILTSIDRPFRNVGNLILNGNTVIRDWMTISTGEVKIK